MSPEGLTMTDMAYADEYAQQSYVNLAAGRRDVAEEMARKALLLRPGHEAALRMLARMGKSSEARTVR